MNSTQATRCFSSSTSAIFCASCQLPHVKTSSTNSLITDYYVVVEGCFDMRGSFIRRGYQHSYSLSSTTSPSIGSSLSDFLSVESVDSSLADSSAEACSYILAPMGMILSFSSLAA